MSFLLNTQLFKKAVSELINISDSKKNAVIHIHIINGQNVFLFNENSNGLKVSFHLKTLNADDETFDFSIEAPSLLKAISSKNVETEIFINRSENTFSLNGTYLSILESDSQLAFQDVEKEPFDISELNSAAMIFSKVSQKDNTYIHFFNNVLLYADPFYLKYHICKLPLIKDCSFNVNNLIQMNSIVSITFKNSEILHFIGSNLNTIQYLNLIEYSGHTMRSFVEFPIEKNLRNSAPFDVRKASSTIEISGFEFTRALNSFLAEIEFVELKGENNLITITPLYTKLKNPLKIPQPISIPFAGSIENFNVKVVRKHLLAVLFEDDIKLQIKQCANIYAEAFEVISVNTAISKGYISTIKAPDLEYVTDKIRNQLAFQTNTPYINV